MNRVLLFAGGKGLRMKLNDNTPKQFLKIDDKYIIIHTIERFEQCDLIDDIIVVCLHGWIDELEKSIKENNIKKVSKIIPGGLTGFDSRINGLEYLSKNCSSKEDIVLIHDGVRPFISDDVIIENINCTKRNRNAITVAPLNETLIYTATNPNKIFQRGNCFLARAPQTFFVDDIYNLYLKAQRDDKTELVDSATIADFYGEKLNFVIGDDDNIKITTKLDFYVAKGIMEMKKTGNLR